MARQISVTALAFACALAVGTTCVYGATTTYNANGTILVDGGKTFPISLNKPPPLAGPTPWGQIRWTRS